MRDKEPFGVRPYSIYPADQDVPVRLVQAAGGIEVDVIGHLVRKEGKVIPISDIDHTLLKVLASRIGEIIPRNVAINEVFGSESAATSEDLTVHVGLLRRKLGIRPDGPIRAIMGIGIILLTPEMAEAWIFKFSTPTISPKT